MNNDPMRKTYRQLTDDETANISDLKGIGEAFLRAVESVETRSGQRREYSLAKTKIEEAVFWAVKGVTG